MGPKKRLKPDLSLSRMTQLLIYGRAALIIVLLFAEWWRGGEFGALLIQPGGGLLTVFGVGIAASAAYYLWIKLGGISFLQPGVQFTVDVFLITWLVWLTGDMVSPYVPLYIVLICSSGFFLQKNSTLLLAIGCAAVLTILSLLIAQDAIFSLSGGQATQRIAQTIGINDIAILIVGLLSARIAERRNISDKLKHTEESFADLHILHERIVESIGTGLVVTDLHGRIYTFNRAAERICGVLSTEAVGGNVFEIFGGEIGRAAEKCLGQKALPPGTPVNFEASFPHGITAASIIVPLLGKTGDIKGLILTFQDITHIKALEATVRRSDRLAAVGRMAAGLAHELRNPLGSMGSALQFLQANTKRSTEDAALMDVVMSESERLNGIITDFLAFARPGSNGFAKNERTEVDIGKAVRNCVSLLRHSPDVTPKHIFYFDLPENPVIIRVNENEIKQVFWNLARNAIQAMPDGGKLSITVTGPENGRVKVIFADTGMGIDQETLEHLFEPFVSGSGGTGLGLSIVYKIVREHGGHINVESRLGSGTSVSVELACEGLNSGKSEWAGRLEAAASGACG